MTMTEQTEAPEQPFRLIYRSHSRISPDDRSVVLAEIFTAARSNNKRSGITGALLVTDNWFVQALEGDESTVRGLYDHIAKDERHDDVTVIESAPVDARVFGKWAMAQVSALGHADIPLHAVEGRIHSAAAPTVTREQSAVLKTMRDTIGADTL
jgi:Sensors of blue-light using FAD